MDLLQWKDHSIEERLEKLYKSIEILRPLDKALVILLLDNRQHKEIAEIIVFFLKKFPDKNLLATIAFLGEIRDMAKNN